MIDQRRAAVLAEVETWLGTPYHHLGRVKGRGVDCLTLLAEVYEAVGLIPHVDLEFYPPDWHLHRGDELYLNGLSRYAREIEGPPQPADIALFRFGRCFSHGAIVTEWPRLIHAWHKAGVLRYDAIQPNLAKRAVRFFDAFR